MKTNAPEGPPALTNLCANEPAAVVSFSSKRLPDGLRLRVVAQVLEVDPHNLNLGVRHIGSMAQQPLHRYPKISYTDDAMPRRIARLTRTLFSRADLARAVARLTPGSTIRLVEILFTKLSAANSLVLQGFFQHTRVYGGDTD